MASREKEKDKSKVHKLSLKGSSKLVAEFVSSKQQPPLIWIPTQIPSLTTNSDRPLPTLSSNTRYIPYCTNPRSSVARRNNCPPRGRGLTNLVCQVPARRLSRRGLHRRQEVWPQYVRSVSHKRTNSGNWTTLLCIWVYLGTSWC